MANRTFDQKLMKEKQRQYNREYRAQQIGCDHKDKNVATLERILDTKIQIRDFNMYPDSTVICKQCYDLMDVKSYTEKDQKMMLFQLRSMANQIKLMDNLSDADFDKVVMILEFADELEHGFFPYYNNVVNQLGENKKAKNNKGTRTKGHMGPGINQFATR